MTSGRGFPGHRTSKKLMLRVRPGVELVRASLVSTSVLITLDLPTFERPRKATSGRLGAGKWAASVAAAMNRAITLMGSSQFLVLGSQFPCLQCAMRHGKLASVDGTSALTELLAQSERLMLVGRAYVRAINLFGAA